MDTKQNPQTQETVETPKKREVTHLSINVSSKNLTTFRKLQNNANTRNFEFTNYVFHILEIGLKYEKSEKCELPTISDIHENSIRKLEERLKNLKSLKNA